MNILFIVTYYPPDTSISTVRPYMYAKYLAQLGHTVTVLRSGLIHVSADHFFEPIPNVRVISYLGPNAPSERFERGEIAAPKKRRNYRGVLKIAAWIYRSFVKVWLLPKKPQDDPQEQMEYRLRMQKNYIDDLADKKEHFDIVFSTYCELENAYAGEYAAKKFGCKWIMDFRDPIAQASVQASDVYRKNKELQDHFVVNADVVTSIAQDCLQEICLNLPVQKSAVLNNGYEMLSEDILYNTVPHILTLCYTGQVYERQEDGVTAFLKVLKYLLDEGVIQKKHICVRLAGQNTNIIVEKARELKLADIFEDHGYTDRQIVSKIQMQSDIFLLFSWNTQKEKGVITGKFYEGIRAQKPILSFIAGTVPNSELYRMNEEYHYGFCYECCRENQFNVLSDYLAQAYHQKMKEGIVRYEPSPQLAVDFRYDNLAKKLSDLCEELVDESI